MKQSWCLRKQDKHEGLVRRGRSPRPPAKCKPERCGEKWGGSHTYSRSSVLQAALPSGKGIVVKHRGRTAAGSADDLGH